MVSRGDGVVQPSMRLALSDESQTTLSKVEKPTAHDRIEYRCIATDGASPHLKNELATKMTQLTDAMGLGGLR